MTNLNNIMFNDNHRWPQSIFTPINSNSMGNDKVINCTTLINPTNSTIFTIDAGWQAIPETIIINLILFSFFLIVFIILRRLAWDRKNVNIKRTSKGWLQSIYGDRKLAAKSLINRENSPIIHHKHDIQEISILLPPNNSFSNNQLRINHNQRTSFRNNSGVGFDATTSSDIGTTDRAFNGHNDNINRNATFSNNIINNVVVEEEPTTTTTSSIHLNLPSTSATAALATPTNGPDDLASLNKSIPSITCISDNPADTGGNKTPTINSNQQQHNQGHQPRIVETPTVEPDGILGTSFDFSSIPTNIQATFTEVGYKLSDVLLISNKDILISRGNDALQYLLFQQYIIYFLAILSLFCTLVVLPINYQGDQFGDSEGFAQTTIMNLPENSPFYWVHVIGASLISLIGIFMMHRFSKVIKLDEEQITRRTLLIRRIPKSKRNKELLAAYFSKVIPNCVIEGIQSVYNVRNLTPLTNELTNLVNARCYCIEYLELKGERLQIRPSAMGELGCLCGCCDSCRKVDGIQFYAQAEEELQQKINAEMKKAVSHPTGGFFITFQTERMAQEAFVHLKQKQERTFSFCPFSSTLTQLSTWCKNVLELPESDELDVARWMVSYAPYPDDINWCDVTVNLRTCWFRSIVVNILLLVLFVFISTPTVIMNASQTLKVSNLVSWVQYFLPSDIGSKIPDLLSPFILVIAASALPAIVTLACQYIAYANTSAKNHAIMWKVYLFLVLMVVIWPSLGITSLNSFILMMLNKGQFPWSCLFPVKLGAFFVCYTIQYAFLGNIMELVRLPELLVYLWYMIIGRSRAEVDTASRYVVWDFSIGIRYPRFLLIFAMVVTYSVSCPLITVAGLVYMVIKHLIDRYNIYYVYNPSKINSKIHSTAIMFVHIALLMMQAQIFTVTLVRTGYSRVFGLALFVFLVSLLVFSGHFFFYMFRNINHLTYRATRKQLRARREYCACAYLPPVLYNLTRYTLNKSPSVATTTAGDYGNGNQQQAGVSHHNSYQLGHRHNNSSGGNSGETVTTTASNNQHNNVNCCDSISSSQNLLSVPAIIDTSDAYFLSGGESAGLNGGVRPKFSQHATSLSTRKHHEKRSRRTASDGQQQFQPSRLIQYEALQLKRTSSDHDM